MEHIQLPASYLSHILAMSKEVRALRAVELELPLGRRCLRYCAAEAKRKSTLLKGEELKRKAMNRIYCTMESRIVKELGLFLGALDIDGLRVEYPVYDGVVLGHRAGSFSWQQHTC